MHTSVQFPTYAENMALPAFARSAAVRRAAICRYPLSVGPTAANPINALGGVQIPPRNGQFGGCDTWAWPDLVARSQYSQLYSPSVL